MGPTFFDFFEIIFKAIKPSPQVIVFEVELDSMSEKGYVKPRNESFEKCYHGEPSIQVFDEDRDTKWCFVISKRYRIDGKS